eukprot:1161721-Pelagomonas_calceolata.AAC.6
MAVAALCGGVPLEDLLLAAQSPNLVKAVQLTASAAKVGFSRHSTSRWGAASSGDQVQEEQFKNEVLPQAADNMQ